jgi:hypothetical protein
MRLRREVSDLEGALRESNETLEAVRAVSSEFMAERNRASRHHSGALTTLTLELTRPAYCDSPLLLWDGSAT